MSFREELKKTVDANTDDKSVERINKYIEDCVNQLAEFVLVDCETRNVKNLLKSKADEIVWGNDTSKNIRVSICLPTWVWCEGNGQEHFFFNRFSESKVECEIFFKFKEANKGITDEFGNSPLKMRQIRQFSYFDNAGESLYDDLYVEMPHFLIEKETLSVRKSIFRGEKRTVRYSIPTALQCYLSKMKARLSEDGVSLVSCEYEFENSEKVEFKAFDESVVREEVIKGKNKNSNLSDRCTRLQINCEVKIYK